MALNHGKILRREDRLEVHSPFDSLVGLHIMLISQSRFLVQFKRNVHLQPTYIFDSPMVNCLGSMALIYRASRDASSICQQGGCR